MYFNANYNTILTSQLSLINRAVFSPLAYLLKLVINGVIY